MRPTALFAAATALFTTGVRAQAPALQLPVPGVPAGVTAFIDVAVVPMDSERVLPGQTVLVQNGRITALGPSSQVTIPPGAVRIDGRGRYLIPGLANMHTHMLFDARDSVEVERRLASWVAQGVTTIRNLDYGLYDYRLDGEFPLRARARAAAGTLLSPRIYTSGPWWPGHFNNPGVGRNTDPFRPPLDSIVARVAAYKAAGYDFIKIYHEPNVVLDSLAVVARRMGIPLVGHARGDPGLEWTIALGAFASFEHLQAYDRDITTNNKWRDTTDAAGIRALAVATQRAGIWNCPTLVIRRGRLYQHIVKALQDVGAGLLLGTDAPLASSVQQELEAFVQAGLTPYQALATGTRNVAVYFKTLDETGTVTVGKRADLVLLRDNPLADIRNAAQPVGVMLAGRWLPQ